MEDTVNKRIMLIITKNGFSITSFSKHIGVSQPALKAVIDGKSKPSFDTLEKILITFPISTDWLILGRGEMEVKEVLVAKPSESPAATDQMLQMISDLSAKNAILNERVKVLEQNKVGYENVTEQLQKQSR